MVIIPGTHVQIFFGFPDFFARTTIGWNLSNTNDSRGSNRVMKF